VSKFQLNVRSKVRGWVSKFRSKFRGGGGGGVEISQLTFNMPFPYAINMYSFQALSAAADAFLPASGSLPTSLSYTAWKARDLLISILIVRHVLSMCLCAFKV